MIVGDLRFLGGEGAEFGGNLFYFGCLRWFGVWVGEPSYAVVEFIL